MADEFTSIIDQTTPAVALTNQTERGTADNNISSRPRRPEPPIPIPVDNVTICPAGSGMVTAWITLTTELAYRCLEANVDNRNMKPWFIARLRADHTNGNWKQHHQGIAFDTDNYLADGQNRCVMVTETGTPIVVLVTWNVPVDAVAAIDAGKERDLVEQLRRLLKNSKHVVYTAIAMERGYRRELRHTQSNFQRYKFILNHEEALRFTRTEFTRHHGRPSPASVMGAFARAYYYIDRDTLRNAIKVFCTQNVGSLPERYTSIHNLAIALHNKGIKDPVKKSMYFHMTEFALCQLMNGEIGKNREYAGSTFVPYESSIFPLPEEVGGRDKLPVRPWESHAKKARRRASRKRKSKPEAAELAAV